MTGDADSWEYLKHLPDVAISFSRRSSQPRVWTQVSRIVGRCFTIWATREDQLLQRYPKDLNLAIGQRTSKHMKQRAFHQHLRTHLHDCLSWGNSSKGPARRKGDWEAICEAKVSVNIHWKDWCWSWSSNTLATWCEELTHLKRPWCWERLKVGGEGDNRGWDGWMVSPTRRTWVWVNSGGWWWTGRPGVLRFMGSQRVGHDWAAEQNWKFQELKTR